MYKSLKRVRILFICLFVFFWSVEALAKPFQGTEFVVSGPSSQAPEVAKLIFKQGGNVVDMAVASALSLSVTHPYYVSLGSGGLALVKMDSEVLALDFRETAPYAMKGDFYQKTRLSSRTGGAAVGTPGFIAGLVDLHAKYGKLPWAKLVEPSIALAKKGFPVTGSWVELTNKNKKKMNSAGRKLFFKKGKSLKPNEIFKQPGLAKALRLIQKSKGGAVYGGVIGRDMVSEVRKEKGLLSLEDFKKYQVRWLKPVSFSFRGYQIYSMPLPSSGGIILGRALKLIEKQKVYKKKLYSMDEMHLLAEIMNRAFWPRTLMGDPGFSDFKEEDWLSNKALEKMDKSLFLKKVRRLPPPKESDETTHLSIMDKKGNAVSMTLTVNGIYGSGLVSPRFGIVLNNQMDDFTTLPGQADIYGLVKGKRNRVEGGKRPLSSMTPTIVEKNKRTVLVLGGAGGPTIITSVLQSLYRYLVGRMDLDQAVSSPRLHQQFLPSYLFVEDKRFSPELVLELKVRGHKVKFRDYIAQVFAVARNRQGILLGAHETRTEGASGGL